MLSLRSSIYSFLTAAVFIDVNFGDGMPTSFYCGSINTTAYKRSQKKRRQSSYVNALTRNYSFRLNYFLHKTWSSGN